MARILLIDDEPPIRFLTRKMLEEAGYEVMEAESGEEGLEILEKEGADLILLDIMMPGMGGWEVCFKIKSVKGLKDIPIVMFTVREKDEDIEESHKCNADGFITKPFKNEELVDTVESLLKKRGSS